MGSKFSIHSIFSINGRTSVGILVSILLLASCGNEEPATSHSPDPVPKAGEDHKAEVPAAPIKSAAAPISQPEAPVEKPAQLPQKTEAPPEAPSMPVISAEALHDAFYSNRKSKQDAMNLYSRKSYIVTGIIKSKSESRGKSLILLEGGVLCVVEKTANTSAISELPVGQSVSFSGIIQDSSSSHTVELTKCSLLSPEIGKISAPGSPKSTATPINSDNQKNAPGPIEAPAADPPSASPAVAHGEESRSTASKTSCWSLTGSPSISRSGHTATLLKSGLVLIAGGMGDSGALVSCDLFDPATKMWTATGSMATRRHHHTATLLPSGQVLVTGGSGSREDGLRTWNTCEIYNPSTGIWTATKSIDEPKSHSATILQNGQVLAIGVGANYRGCQLYNPTSGAWSGTGALLEGRGGDTQVILLNSGQVLVLGGGSGRTETAELYNPNTGTWSATGSKSLTRRGAELVLLKSGKVLAIGGLGGAPSMLQSSCELYDPANGTWKPTGVMNHARSNVSATLLHTGQVLVTGGDSGRGTCELYNPDTEKWTDSENMPPGINYTQTLLLDGTVLLAGGETRIPFDKAAARPYKSMIYNIAGSPVAQNTTGKIAGSDEARLPVTKEMLMSIPLLAHADWKPNDLLGAAVETAQLSKADPVLGQFTVSVTISGANADGLLRRVSLLGATSDSGMVPVLSGILSTIACTSAYGKNELNNSDFSDQIKLLSTALTGGAEKSSTTIHGCLVQISHTVAVGKALMTIVISRESANGPDGASSAKGAQQVAESAPANWTRYTPDSFLMATTAHVQACLKEMKREQGGQSVDWNSNLGGVRFVLNGAGVISEAHLVVTLNKSFGIIDPYNVAAMKFASDLIETLFPDSTKRIALVDDGQNVSFAQMMVRVPIVVAWNGREDPNSSWKKYWDVKNNPLSYSSTINAAKVTGEGSTQGGVLSIIIDITSP